MRLSLSLCLFKLPNGHIFRGKNRIVKRVTRYDIETLKDDYEREEQNMFYLRHPYLTREQSLNHAQALKKKENWMKAILASQSAKFSKHRRLEDELSHLKNSENWEFGAGSQI